MVYAQASSRWKRGECKTQQDQHAIRPVPLAWGIRQSNVELNSKHGCQDGPEAGEEAKEQTERHHQLSGPGEGPEQPEVGQEDVLDDKSVARQKRVLSFLHDVDLIRKLKDDHTDENK